MNINVSLDEPLTSNNCAKLVVELLKYILYQKNQIPFTYDSLSRLKMKPNDRNLTSVKTLLDSMQSTSDQLNSQFHQRDCKVKEISILIGATIISPKLHIKVEFPPDILDSQVHFDYKHVSRKPMLNLMRSMLECSEFQDALASPLNPTNTFVLIQKSDSNSVSEFFLPKPQYAPPVHVSNYFVIKLQHNDTINDICNCMSLVRVYNDVSEPSDRKRKSVEFVKNSDAGARPVSYQWYQSKEVIKGFQFLR